MRTPTSPGHSEFTAFMRDHHDMVYSTARRLMGNEAQAADIAQETFLKAYQHFGQLRGSATAGGWLRTVATRLALNQLTRYRRRWRFFSELESSAGPESEGEGVIERAAAALDDVCAQVEAQERAGRVRQSLDALPPHQRTALVLFHYQEMSYQDIAAELKVSVAKVKTDILRGRLALARRLAGDGPEPAASVGRME